ncbi:phosphoenolpyruvate--protein phosphotransferase [Thioalkalivibrio sp. ALMg13-2]|uniref:phosphoenolpyruvate--protein phosphotransferase n=1 Tax=Thioalkalivibrio sp. ALMg13-2 TaxID=1158167 RepID=UPI00036DB719|nr:phosphoenolpyruvate--protein phosphotransferase [Thioalkalivibrio sp. ALMg13-2]
MLEVLRRVVQEVNGAADFFEALHIIVTRVKAALEIDVCSIYLKSPQSGRLVLMASEGLREESIGQVEMDPSEGLVGLVASRAEPVNLDSAQDHPRFRYFPETGEEHFLAFLGVPIIHQRSLLGVLVVQQHQARKFDDEHVSFLITLAAQLAGAIAYAEFNDEISSETPLIGHVNVEATGIAGSPGVAIGRAVVAYRLADMDSIPDREGAGVDHELEHFGQAVAETRTEIEDLKQRMGEALGPDEQVLFDAYLMLLGSDSLVHKTQTRIRNGQWAPAALRDTVRESVRVFEDMEDPYLRERAADVRDLGRRVLSHLLPADRSQDEFPDGGILVGDDLTASHLAEVPIERLGAMVSAKGTGSSHIAILARALNIPAVMGVSELPVGRLEGREILVDGYRGRLFVNPNAELRVEFERLVREERELAEDLRALAKDPAETRDGVAVPVLANSGLLADIKPSLASGAEGVGLYRTEVPFMIRDRFPGEEEQVQLYEQVLASFDPMPVTLRTLDIGGDKALPYFPVKEDNPFLGWRGIRISLDHPEIFLTQLRAMLKASRSHDNLQILFPMISALDELKGAMTLLNRAREELLDEGFRIPMPRIGVMVEVPAAVYMSEMLARRVDFLSVGTNDLVQYLLAVDRNNARVAHLYDTLHPACIHALETITDGSHRAGKPVSVCGEMAADPAAVILLLGMGIDSLSVSVSSIPRVKWVIRSFSTDRAEALLAQCRLLENADQIRSLLNNALVQAGLGGLVRAGKT